MQVAQDGLDVLIALDGHTSSCRALALASHSLAPVQVDYLGYPASTGMDAIQYKVVDHVTDPEGAPWERFYSESLLRLPRCLLCWQPPGDVTQVGPRLPGPVRLLSANNWKKCRPSFLRLCQAVLRRCPDAELHFKSTLHEGAAGLFETAIARHFEEDVRPRYQESNIMAPSRDGIMNLAALPRELCLHILARMDRLSMQACGIPPGRVRAPACLLSLPRPIQFCEDEFGVRFGKFCKYYNMARGSWTLSDGRVWLAYWYT